MNSTLPPAIFPKEWLAQFQKQSYSEVIAQSLSSLNLQLLALEEDEKGLRVTFTEARRVQDASSR